MRKTHPCFRLGKRPVRTGGFTLIELLVVIAVVGILGLATATFFIQWLPRMRFQAKMEEVGTLMQRARLHAIQTNQNVTVAEDPASDFGTWQHLVATAADGREVGRVVIPKPESVSARLYMVTDPGAVAAALDGADAAIHCVAVVSLDARGNAQGIENSIATITVRMRMASPWK